MTWILGYLAGCVVAWGFTEVAQDVHPETRWLPAGQAWLVSLWPITLLIFIGFALGHAYYGTGK